MCRAGDFEHHRDAGARELAGFGDTERIVMAEDLELHVLL
jgi:hypothetical protein